MHKISTALELTPTQVEQVIGLAGLAPSLHNTQPWQFRILPHLIELHFDPARRLPIADPDGRELRLACGAALFNLRIALESAGVRPLVTLLPHLAHPTTLAEIRGGGRPEPRPLAVKLHAAIPQRHSHREPFRDVPVQTTDRHELLLAAQSEQCWLHVVTPGELGALEGLVHRAHRTQQADSRFRAELAAWTGQSTGAVDGVPTDAAGPRPEPQDQWVHRDFSGGLAERPEGTAYESWPLLVVLCTPHDSPADELRAGQALENVWLTATSRNLSASMISEVVEVREIRDELRQLLGGTLHPQAMLRIGYGRPTVPAPRRAVGDLLLDGSTPI